MAEENEQQTTEQAAPSEAPAKSGKGKAAKKQPMRKILTMAPHKARVTRKGIVGPGDELTLEHFRGGQRRLDELRKAGVVVEMEVPDKAKG